MSPPAAGADTLSFKRGQGMVGGMNFGNFIATLKKNS